MRALVLAAGLGTRQQPLTLARAKAAAPVDGEPLVRRTIRWLTRQGVTDLVVNLHHKPETIAAVVGDGADLGARVRYSWESPVLGSAGGPRHALPLLLSDAAERTCVLVNGDTLTSVDLAAMIDQHRRTGADVTMAVIANPRPDKYGSIQLDERQAVTGFTRRGTEGFHFIGPQVIEADVFLPLADGVPSETVVGLYPQLIARRRGSVMGFVSSATFHDIGTPADLLETSLAFAAADGRPDRPRWGRGVRVASSARVTRSDLWDNVTIEDGCDLEECVVADGVTVPRGARYHRCAIVRSGDTLLAQPLG